MFQAATTDFFNPLVPKAHNSERQNLPYPLQIQPSKSRLKLGLRIFIFVPSALMDIQK